MSTENKGDKAKEKAKEDALLKKPVSEMTPDEKIEVDSILARRLEDKKNQVEQLSKTAGELTETVGKLRTEKRTLDFVPGFDKPAAPEKPKGSEEEFEDEPLTKQDLAAFQQKGKQEQYVKDVDQAVRKFLKEHTEDYSEEKDLGGVKYERIKAYAKRTFLGDNSDEIYETLQVFHNGLFGAKPKGKEEDEGIGVTETVPRRTETKKVDWMKKKFNEAEQKSAGVYPGGESAYRKWKAQHEKE